MGIQPRLSLGTVAFDSQGSRNSRVLAKVLGSGLLRSLFDGAITIIRNSPHPLFLVERVGLEEIQVDPQASVANPETTKNAAINWRFELVEHLARRAESDWFIVSDLDVVPMRNWDHLFADQPADILVNRAADGSPDVGFFAVKGSRIRDFSAAWKEAQAFVETRSGTRKDKLALAALLESGEWQAQTFERGEVMRPFDTAINMRHALEAACLHLEGGSQKEKARFSFALYMMWVYGADDGVFLDLLES